jgi:hypothetical protein
MRKDALGVHSGKENSENILLRNSIPNYYIL